MIITELENGNLKLELEAEDREDFDYESNKNNYQALEYNMYDLFEDYSYNGGYTLFDAGDANPFVGLTDAPCIGEAMDSDDDGNRSVIGKLWHYSDYMVSNYIDELYKNGFVIFEFAGDYDKDLIIII